MRRSLALGPVHLLLNYLCGVLSSFWVTWWFSEFSPVFNPLFPLDFGGLGAPTQLCKPVFSSMSLVFGFFIHISLSPDSFVLASSIDFYLIVGIPKNCLSAEVQEEGAKWGVYKNVSPECSGGEGVLSTNVPSGKLSLTRVWLSKLNSEQVPLGTCLPWGFDRVTFFHFGFWFWSAFLSFFLF